MCTAFKIFSWFVVAPIPVQDGVITPARARQLLDTVGIESRVADELVPILEECPHATLTFEAFVEYVEEALV